MRYLSVCSGIEAATVAWHDLGWEAAAYSEIEKFPSAVLAHHYPHVPNLGDMTNFKEWPNDSIDLLVGGTPCQSFSVAGLRKGLADPRGNLMLTFGAIADKYRPRWLVWENVPGVLSSNRGRDFAAFLGTLEELGYGFAYRVLDAQYFGVAQRRRRVFVVGYLGDWRPAAAVLFERESLCGNPAPSREKGQEVTPTIRSGATNGSPGHGQRSGDSRDELMVPVKTFACEGIGSYSSSSSSATLLKTGQDLGPGCETLIARCDTAGECKRQDYETCTIVAHTLKGEGFNASEDGTGRQNLVPVAFAFEPGIAKRDGSECRFNKEISPTLRSQMGDNQTAVALLQDVSGRENVQIGKGWSDEGVSYTLDAAATQGEAQYRSVRRLTPTECERLQGFPDKYTDIRPKGKDTPDGPRYKALGNSMAVPVMRWIGKRIEMVEALKQNTYKEAVNE